MQKEYDLEKRTTKFAADVRTFACKVHRTPYNLDDLRQLIRSSGSIAANYIEANESLTAKEVLHRINISRKEAKETELWLKLAVIDQPLEGIRRDLIEECIQLKKIFGKIVSKLSNP